MGSATACTSSMSGLKRPRANAWHLAPITRNWLALGPAPQLTWSWITLGVPGRPGRVRVASFTAYSITLSGTGSRRTRPW